MAKIGIVTPPTAGHINPFIYIAKELETKGHEIVFFQVAEVKARIEKAGMKLHPIGKNVLPPNAVHTIQKELGALSGLEAMKYWLRGQLSVLKMWFRELPGAFEAEQLDFVLTDQSDPTAATVAEYMGIPFISVAVGLNLDWEESIPPFFTGWELQDSPSARRRYALAVDAFQKDFEQLFNTINAERKKHQLAPYDCRKNFYPVSPHAQLAQIPEFLDYPRKESPAHFENVGPIRSKERPQIPFPYERLNPDKPMVYFSLGTILNMRADIFNMVARAFKNLDVQLVISLGKQPVEINYDDIPDDAIIVDYVPQFELLSRARMCVTHGGLNTVMDAISQGVPALAIPISFDQPGTAARLRRSGAGDYIPYQKLSTELVHKHAKALLEDPKYLENAQLIKAKFANLDGRVRIVEIIESILNQEETKFINQKHQYHGTHV